MCVNQGFGKGHIVLQGFGTAIFRKKTMRAQKPVDQVSDIKSDGANRWQTQQKNGTNNHRNDSKDVQNQAGVERGVGRVEPTTT